MASYHYVQRYRPSTGNRIPEVVAFIEASLRRLGSPVLFDSDKHPIACTEAVVLGIVERARRGMPPGLTATFDLFAGAGSDEKVCRYDIGVGTSPGMIFIDFFGLQFGREVPPFNDDETVRSLLSIGDPFEAFLAENNNECNLRAHERQNRIPGFFSRPSIIRGTHFLGADLVGSLGGIEKCLGAPVHSAENFRDGVILRLVPGILDPGDAGQLAAQEAVMQYFGM